jgi:hypothetical protein
VRAKGSLDGFERYLRVLLGITGNRWKLEQVIVDDRISTSEAQ